MDFKSKLSKSWKKNNSLLCIGLDPDLVKIPTKFKKTKAPFFEFNKTIVDSTVDLVCTYKFNSAMYESLGANGIEQLQRSFKYIHDIDPDLPIILDFKRGDIGNTNNYYADFAFKYLNADAITISPYMGREANEAFLSYKNKGIIVLCRTSNPGASEFQDLKIKGQYLYKIVAEKVMNTWNYNDNCCLVIGAPYPKELSVMRKSLGNEAIFLIPGVGAQGGGIKDTVMSSVNNVGEGIIINVSRGVIFQQDVKNYGLKVREKALELRKEINIYRSERLNGS